MQFLAKFTRLLKDHRLSAGDNNVVSFPFRNGGHDRVHRPRIPFWLPGCVASVAKPAAKIATARANEHAWGTRQSTFPLDAMENF